MIDLVGATLWALAGFLFARHDSATGGIAVAIYALLGVGAIIITML